MNGNGIPQASQRVLLAEDQALIALDLRQVLRKLGHTVLGPVPSVAGAFELIGRERPDAAVLDLDLLDGWVTPVARLLAAEGVPFLVVTGYGDETPKLADPVLAAAPLLLKPFGSAQLEQMLARLLAVRRTGRTAPAAPGCGQGCDPAATRPPPAPP